ncbi:MAG: serine/threonine protein kinase [Xanthomonadales bacterium]|nr:serine/threonine protein kinase [Xanthomonadales bacterium]
MSRIDFERLDALFHDALEKPEAERAAFIEQSCGDDEALRRRLLAMLAQDAKASANPDTNTDPLTRAVAAGRRRFGNDDAMPERIGPFRLLRMLGQGGMGTVYLGEREDSDFQQQAAIKLLHSVGDDVRTAARLRRERALLARLGHPHIAQLIDGGELDDGTPWVAMEYVEGQTLTRYVDTSRLGIGARIALFQQLLDAVAYAHRHLVVHRDIKPENVLVDGDGNVKLLDFGIAKLIEDEGAQGTPATMTVAGAMTPVYASPEQLQGQAVSTQSDVYSLGVVLYELLAGQLPFPPEPGITPLALQQRICTTQAVPPSRVARDDLPRRRLRGDLDRIVLKALRKEPPRRYASVDALADDLRRHRNGLPVSARPDSLGYRVSKFVSRNPAGVAASLLLLGTLIAFALVSRWQTVQIAAQRDRAEQEATAANQVAEAMIELFRVPDPIMTAERDLTARDLLDQAAAALPDKMQDAPLLRARMLHVIALSYANIGAYERSVAQFEEALRIREQEVGGESLETSETLNRLGNVHRMYGHLELAEPLLLRALTIREKLGTGPDLALADSYNNVGLMQYDLGHDVDALATLQKSIDMHRAVSGEDTVAVAIALHNRTLALRRLGRDEEAIREIEQSLAIKRHHGLDGRSTMMNSLGLRAELLADQGRYDEALAIRKQTLQRRRELYPEGHPSLISGLLNMAQLRIAMGHPDDAGPLLEEADQWARKIDPDRGLITASVRIAQGRLALAQHENERAQKLFNTALTIRRDKLPIDHPDIAEANLLPESID